MTPISKISHLGFDTPDVERMTDYYCDVLGMHVSAEDGGHVYLSSCMGRQAVVLRQGAQARCTTLCFEIAAASDLDRVVAELASAGVAAEICSDAAPGIAKMVRLRDFKGTEIELLPGPAPMEIPSQAHGAGVLRLGHVAYAVTDIDLAVDYYSRLFGFRVSDWMGDFFVWLRCNAEHHTVNFIRGEHNGMHHHAFELADWAHLQRACDHLSVSGFRLDWGPGRHGIGHNIFAYHHNPDGHIVEFYTEIDMILDEESNSYEPRPWHRNAPQRPGVWEPEGDASNLWGAPAPPGWRK